jgi:hypothetical protein
VPDIRFDFGKYYGRPVADVPSGYLQWCLRECECLCTSLREAIEAELRRRGARAGGGHARGAGAGGGNGATAGPPPAALSEALAAWYRQACLEFHPDRGGDVRVMQAINDIYGRLRQLMGG